MAHKKTAKDMREDERKRKQKKKPQVFRNDQLQTWLFKLLEKPEFKHLKPKREEQANDKTGSGEGDEGKRRDNQN